MKFSIYNSVITVEEKYQIVYNSLSGLFLVFNQLSFDIKDGNIEDLRQNKPLLFKKLYDFGIIIDDDFDEIGILKNKISDAINNENEFTLHINPTLDCNFQCWYCYENHLKDSKISQQLLNAIKSYISLLLVNNQRLERFHIGFFGGEPLLRFDYCVKDLIEFTQIECDKVNVKLFIHFTTNGSLINKNILQFLKKYNCGFQITLDGDRTQHNKTRFFRNGNGSFDNIVKNIINLASNGLEVIARVNYTAQNIESTASILDNFSNLDESVRPFILFDFQRVWQDREIRQDDVEKKAMEIRKLFIHNGFTVLTNYIPHDACSLCYGDKKNHILINYDGNVFGCTARDFTEMNSLGRLNLNGIIEYKEDIVRKRNKSKFAKPICHTCRIAPLCGGGCKQCASEDVNFETCTLGYTEEDKDDIILNIFDYVFCNEK